MDCPLKALSKRRATRKQKTHGSHTAEATNIQSKPTLKRESATLGQECQDGRRLTQQNRREETTRTAAKYDTSYKPSAKPRRSHTVSIDREPAAGTNEESAAVAELTSKRLHEVIPEFDPYIYLSSKQNMASTCKAPSITISDEAGNTKKVSVTPERRNSGLKPMPDLVLSIPDILTSSARRPSASSTSTIDSDTSSIKQRLSRLRSSSIDSGMSTWTRPDSASSLLPPPLDIKKSRAAIVDTRNQEAPEAQSAQPYQHVREMYSYETLDYTALLDEVAESPERRLWRKLPFMKKKSDLDVSNQHASVTPPAPKRAAIEKPEASGPRFRHLSASTVASTIDFMATSSSAHSSPSLKPADSTHSKSSATSSSTRTQTDITSNLSRGDTAATSLSAPDSPPNTNAPPLPGAHPSWRRYVPARCLRDDEETYKLVRTASGHRILQLREAVYDSEGRIVYRPLVPSSLRADDSTRLSLLPLSSAGTDVISWNGREHGVEAIRGDVCLGRDLMGGLDNESVVWAGGVDGMGLEEIERSLRRTDTKRVVNKGKDQAL